MSKLDLNINRPLTDAEIEEFLKKKKIRKPEPTFEFPNIMVIVMVRWETIEKIKCFNTDGCVLFHGKRTPPD